MCAGFLPNRTLQMLCTDANMLTVRTGEAMASWAVNKSKLRTEPSLFIRVGSWPKNGMHLISKSAWYNGCERKSPVHLATMIVIMISSNWWMSLVISTMMTVRLMVSLVTPPKKLTDPSRANAPGSIQAQYLLVWMPNLSTNKHPTIRP